MHWPTVMTQTAQHYATLARTPGWLAQARHSVNTLEADDSGLWVGLRAQVRALLDRGEVGQGSDQQQPTHGQNGRKA